MMHVYIKPLETYHTQEKTSKEKEWDHVYIQRKKD